MFLLSRTRSGNYPVLYNVYTYLFPPYYHLEELEGAMKAVRGCTAYLEMDYGIIVSCDPAYTVKTTS